MQQEVQRLLGDCQRQRTPLEDGRQVGLDEDARR